MATIYEIIRQRKRGLAGSMTAVKGHEIVPIRLSEIVGKTNLVPPQLYEMGSRFFLSMASNGSSCVSFMNHPLGVSSTLHFPSLPRYLTN
jgi:hypothetical protein